MRTPHDDVLLVALIELILIIYINFNTLNIIIEKIIYHDDM